VSKAIDKRGGNVAGFAEFRDAVKAAMERTGVSRQQLQDALGNFMLSHYLTAGSQPAVPVLRDYRIIRDTVGLGHEFDELFNDEAEREVVGKSKTGGAAAWQNGMQNKEDAAGRYTGQTEWDITAPATDAAREWAGWGTALKPAHEPICLARKPFPGTVAANVQRWGTGAVNVDGCRIGCESDEDKKSIYRKPAPNGNLNTETAFKKNTSKVVGNVYGAPAGRWPSNIIHDGSDEVVGLFPAEGNGNGPREAVRGGHKFGGDKGQNDTLVGRWHGDSGSAARYFYCAKADRAERNAGCDGLPEKVKDAEYRQPTGNPFVDCIHGCGKSATNHHPTVKPIDLLRYLCRLITPRGGVVLDPFLGSGSTACACALEGFGCIGIEREAEYIEIARRRVAYWRGRYQGRLFE